MYVLSSKLKNLKEKLKIWNKDVFGNIYNAVTEAENMLHEVQDQIKIQGHNDCLMQERRKHKSPGMKPYTNKTFSGRKKLGLIST